MPYSMICPHCSHTIPDTNRDATQINPQAEGLVWPPWAVKGACLLLGFVILVGVLVMHANAVSPK